MNTGIVAAPVLPIAIAATITFPVVQVGCATVTLIAGVACGTVAAVVLFHVIAGGIASGFASIA